MHAVLVAGGTGALGGAVLRELLEAGHRVTATWVAERERDRVQEELGDAPGLSLTQADLMEPDAVQAAVDSVDGLGAVVNLVGGFSSGPRVHEIEPDEWERMLRLNLRPFAGAAAYVTAKAGVLAFVRALDADYRADGVRANAVLPSVIDTPANRAASPDADYSKWVPPAEIAKVIRFLVSEDSAITSGGAIPVYGRA